MNSLLYKCCFGFPDRALEARFRDWLRPIRQRQIGAIATLTGLLYLLNAALNYFVAPPELYFRMVVVRVLVVPPILLLIGALSFLSRRYRLVTGLLMLSPVVAASASFYVFGRLDEISTHLTELYLMLLWVFVVTGLTLNRAMISAAATLAVVAFGTYAFLDLSTLQLSYHVFWIFCSLSFGLVGGYLIESSSRESFLAQQELEQAAVTDKLTGLYNRVRLKDVLGRELERSRRHERPFGVIILDVDHFKEVNDTHGHFTGDELLVELAELLKSNCRSSDSLFRWGGEEFLIISPETNRSGLQAQADKLGRLVAQHDFPLVDQITVSIGATHYVQGDAAEQILERADQALYRAKNGGRNQVVFAG